MTITYGVHQCVFENIGFQMIDFETPKSNSEVSNSNLLKITSLSKTTLLQREPLLTMFYTITLTPITRYEVRFYGSNYFEYLPMVASPFKTVDRLFKLF